jgi:hypothetical protein
VDHKRVDAAVLGEFFGMQLSSKLFPTHQHFNFESLKGRMLSSSYVPEAGHRNYQPMLNALRQLFDAHQKNGEVIFEYDTVVWFGRLQH